MIDSGPTQQGARGMPLLFGAAVLTYPIWGSLAADSLASLLPKNSSERELVLSFFMLLNIPCAIPIWMSPSLGPLIKITLTLLFYGFAYVAWLTVWLFYGCRVLG